MDEVVHPVADLEREGVPRAGGAAVGMRGLGEEVQGEGEALQGEGGSEEVVEERGDLEGDEELELGVDFRGGGDVVGGLGEGVGERVVRGEAEGVVCVRGSGGGGGVAARPDGVQGGVVGAVEVVVVVAAFVVVLVVVRVVGRAAHVVDVDFVGVVLPPPLVLAVGALGRVDAEVGEGDPVELDAGEAAEEGLAGGAAVGDAREDLQEDVGPAAEEDGVVGEEHGEGFARDEPVEEEVFVVEEQEDGGGRGLEVLQVTPLDAEGAVAAVIGEGEGVVVDLVACQYNLPASTCQRVSWLGIDRRQRTWSRSSRGSCKKGKMSFRSRGALSTSWSVAAASIMGVSLSMSMSMSGMTRLW